MGFTFGGDIAQSSSRAISDGGLGRPLIDQTAFDLSGPIAALVIVFAIAVILLALWAGMQMGMIENRITGFILISAGAAALIATALLVWGVQSDPLDLGGRSPGAELLNWGALIGPKLAAVSAGVMIAAGGLVVASDAKNGAASS